ncbi:hypothetical protein HRbin34_00292 [bacterium HR34]|nr:hypothetical protein HRbin34_00292 [bacterium HR34]
MNFETYKPPNNNGNEKDRKNFLEHPTVHFSTEEECNKFIEKIKKEYSLEKEEYEEKIIEGLKNFLEELANPKNQHIIYSFGIKENPFAQINKRKIEKLKELLSNVCILKDFNLEKLPKGLEESEGISILIKGERRAIFIKKQKSKEAFLSVLLHELIHCLPKGQIIQLTNKTDESYVKKFIEFFKNDLVSRLSKKPKINQLDSLTEKTLNKILESENKNEEDIKENSKNTENIEETEELMKEIKNILVDSKEILKGVISSDFIYKSGFYVNFRNIKNLFLLFEELFAEGIKRNLFQVAAKKIFNNRNIKQEFYYKNILDSKIGKNDMQVFNKFINDVAQNQFDGDTEKTKTILIESYLNSNFVLLFTLIDHTYGKENAIKLATSTNANEIKNIITEHG